MERLETATGGHGGQFDPAGYPQLGVDVGEMGLDGPPADQEPFADLRVAQTLRGETDWLA